MNITKQQVDALNAVVTVAVTKEDYSDKVAKILANYRKNASIPGFRKGAVPMSLIKKQYEKAVLVDEVNKLLQESLNNYLVAEKLDILGNPLPKVTEDFNWDAENYDFQFELGLAPAFEISLDTKKAVKKYKIVAEDSMINQQVERIQKQYGKMIPKDTVEEKDDINGNFTNEEKGIDAPASITLDLFKNKTEAQKFIGKKVGDVVTIATKGLFEDDHDLMTYLKVSHDDVHGLDIQVDFTISSISSSEPAELNQELFDKLFGPGKISSVEELKNTIKEDAENQFAQQGDQKFISDVSEYLLENTKFDLPAEFLIKWLQTAGEKQLTAEEAAEEFKKSEKGLRYQLIEGKIIKDNNLQITFDDLKSFTADLIKKQMAQFGQIDPSEEDVNNIVARVLSNQDEIKRLSEQAMSVKILNFYQNNIQAPVEEVTYQDFIKISYGE
jgi:trigger factor